MEVHVCRQEKTIPIHRIRHATLERVYPLAHENRNFHRRA